MRIGLIISFLVSIVAAQVTVRDTFFTGTYYLDESRLTGNNVKIRQSDETDTFGYECFAETPGVYTLSGGVNAGLQVATFYTPVTNHVAYMDSTGTFYDTTTWQKLGNLAPIQVRDPRIVVTKKFRMYPPTSVLTRTTVRRYIGNTALHVTKTVDVRGRVTSSRGIIYIQNGRLMQREVWAK